MGFKDRLQTLIQELQLIPWKIEKKLRWYGRKFYFFSNEKDVVDVINQLAQAPIYEDKEKIRVALLVGQSSFCSMLPELSAHCDLVIFSDLNQFLLNHNKFLLRCLSQDNVEMAKKYYHENRQDYQLPLEGRRHERLNTSARQEVLGDKFFLSDDARFQLCKEATQRLQFAFLPINLYDQSLVSSLKEKLEASHAKIVFINLTNMYEWDARHCLYQVTKNKKWRPYHQLNELVRILEVEKNTLIMAATRELSDGALHAHLFPSFAEYLKSNKKAVKDYLTEKNIWHKSKTRKM